MAVGALAMCGTASASTSDVCDGSYTNADGISVSATHGRALYIDTSVSPQLDAAYAAYRVTNTGSSRSGLWMSLESFNGGVVSLANPLDRDQQLGTVASASPRTAFFLLKAPQPTSSLQSHVVRVYDRRPDVAGAQEVYSCKFTFQKVQETIKANANKVTQSAVSSSRQVGDLLTIKVRGATGTIGAGRAPDGSMVWVTPAASSAWPTRALRLESTSVVFGDLKNNTNWDTSPDWNTAPTASSTLTNTLIVRTASTTLSGRPDYISTYNFRIAGAAAASSVALSPTAQISSGTQVKHSVLSLTGSNPTTVTSIGSGSITNPLTASKQVLDSSGNAITSGTSSTFQTFTDAGGTFYEVPYRVTVSSSSSTASTLDEVVDTPTTGVSVKPGSVTVTDSTGTRSLADPALVASEADKSPRPVHFVGPFSATSSASVRLRYTMRVPCSADTAQTFSNFAFAWSGGTTIGATASVVPGQSVTTGGATCTGTATATATTQSIDPTVETQAASSVTSSAATLNALVDGNDRNPTVAFEWGTSPTLAGATTTSGTSVSGTSATAITRSLSGLSSGTTYYYRPVATISGSDTVVTGAIMSFTTPEQAANPTASTAPATGLGGTGATLNGSVDANLTSSKVKFKYWSQSAGEGSATTTGFVQEELVSDAGVVSYTDLILTSGFPLDVSQAVTGLTAGTLYEYRVIAYYGTSYATTAQGGVQSFRAGTTQTITFNAIADKASTASDFQVSASASSGLTPTLTSETPTVCTVKPSSSPSATGTAGPEASPALVDVLAVGTCTLTANQPGGTASSITYASADPVSQSFAVIAAPAPTITSPTASARLTDTTPSISGACEDGLSVLVRIYPGASATGTPVETTANCTAGAYTATPGSALPEGDNTAVAIQTNSVATGESAARTFAIDTTAPSPAITVPSASAVLGDTTPTLSGTCTAGDGAVTVTLYSGASATGAPVQTLSAACTAGSWSVDAAALTAGEYTARASQTDAAGNTGASATRTFSIDVTAPTVTLTTPAAAAVLSDSTPGLAGACTAGDGSVSIPVYPGASASGTPNQTATTTCSAGSWSVDATTLVDGQYTARAAQTDAAGNTGQSSARTFTIDTAAPTVTVAPEDASTSASTASFTVSFSEGVTGFGAGDVTVGGTSASPAWTVSGVTGSAATYRVTLSAGSTPSLGTLTLKVNALTVTDAAGNAGPVADSSVASMDIVSAGDLTGGALEANGGAAWGRQRSLAVVKTEVSAPGGGVTNKLFRHTAPWSAGDCGVYDAGTEIAVSTTSDDTSSIGDACFRYDLVGSKGGSTKRVESNFVKVDLTRPANGVLSTRTDSQRSWSAAAWTKAARPAFRKTAFTDAASGVRNGSVTLTRSFLSFGGANATCSSTVYPDSGADVVDIASAALTGDVDDSASGELPEGCYRYRHAAEDVAGNTSTEDAIVKIDRTNPVDGTLTANGGNDWTRATSPTLAGTDYSDANSGIPSGGSTIAREKATLSGSGCLNDWAVDSSGVNDSGGADNATLVQACYRYTRSATDRAGNSTTTTPSVVKIDLTNPSSGALSIAGGNDRLTNSASPSIGRSAESDANSGINAASEKLTRAFVAYSNEACGTFGTYDPNTETTVSNSATADSGLATGCYRYTRKVGDNAGNTATTSSTVRVDVTNPSLGNLLIAGGTNQLTNGAAPSIAKGSTSDAASGLKASDEKLTRASTDFTGNSCGAFAAYDAGTETDVTLSATADSGLASGCYRYTHRVADNAGNAVTAQSVVQVDVNNPISGSISVNGGGAWTNSQKPSLAGNPFTDVHSGIAAGGATLRREKATLNGASCDNDWAVDQSTVNDAGGTENDTLVQACYRYTRAATDRAGNAAQVAGSVKVDRTLPSGGSVTVAASGWTRAQSPSVGGTAFSDANSGIDTTSLTRQRAPLTGQTCGTYGTPTTVTLANGDDSATLDQACYRYTRGASDVAGNSTTTDSVVKIDRTDPTGGVVTANGGNGTWTKDAKPSLARSTVADTNSGLASDTFVRGFAPFNGNGNCTGVSYAGSDAVTVDGSGRDADGNTLPEGCYRYRSTAADNVGNTTTSDATVFIDRTTPSGGSISAAKTSGAWANTTSPGLSGSAFTDANSGIDSSAVRIVRERAGYVSGSNTCSNTWSVDEASVTVSNGRDTDALDEACYRYTREAADNAGNTVATAPDPVQLDLTAPGGGTVTINGGTDVDAIAGTPPTMGVGAFSDALSGLRQGSETLTRRIAPWTGSAPASSSRVSGPGVRVAQEFGDYGSAVPVTLVGTEDPIAVNPGRYFYEHTVTDESGNVTTRTALVEIRPPGVSPAPEPSPGPSPSPAPIPPAERPAPEVALQLDLFAPATPPRANVPFPTRAVIRNVGSATADRVTFTTTAPNDVLVLAAEIRAAGRSEMQARGRCAIVESKRVECTIPALEARYQQVIDMTMVTPTGGFRIDLAGNTGAANATPVDATASTPLEIEELTKGGTPRLTVKATTRRKTVTSGSTISVAVAVAVREADAQRLIVTVPTGTRMRLARVPGGTDLLDRATGSLGAAGMAANSTRRFTMRFRVTGPVGATVRVPVTAAAPGAQAVTARTTAVTIVADRHAAVTG